MNNRELKGGTYTVPPDYIKLYGSTVRMPYENHRAVTSKHLSFRLICQKKVTQ